MPARELIALGLSRAALRAVVAAPRPGGLRLERVLVVDRPGRLQGADPAELGAWVGEQLRKAGVPRGRAVFALSRDQLGVKRLTLPTTDPIELPEMTRLAMQRELPFDASGAVIDFIPVGRSETATTVLAVAVPEDALARTRQMLAAADMGVERVSLRAMGVAALLSSLDEDSARRGLAIDVTPDSLEFCFVERGEVRTSRAADATGDADPATLARAVETETRRTWMSFRIVEDAENVSRAVLIGPAEVVARATPPIGEMLGVPAIQLDAHPRIDAAGHDPGSCWPLVGLLLEPALGRPTIDFAAPRRVPDLGARRRQLALAGVGLGVLLVAALVMLALVDLHKLRREKSLLDEKLDAARPHVLRARRDHYRLQHLEQWESAAVDWLEHLRHLAALTPPADRLVLDRWAGVLEFRGVRYDEKTRKFSAPRLVRINVEGEAADRATAAGLRGELVRETVYTARASGTESSARGKRLPVPFSYALRTDRRAPAGVADEASSADGDDGGATPAATLAGAQAAGQPAAAPADPDEEGTP